MQQGSVAVGAGTSAGEALHLAQDLVLRLYEASLRGLDRVRGLQEQQSPCLGLGYRSEASLWPPNCTYCTTCTASVAYGRIQLNQLWLTVGIVSPWFLDVSLGISRASLWGSSGDAWAGSWGLGLGLG